MSLLPKNSDDLSTEAAILIIVIAFLISLLIVKLLTIIVPGLPFWPIVGILWLLKLFF